MEDITEAELKEVAADLVQLEKEEPLPESKLVQGLREVAQFFGIDLENV